MSLIHYKSTFKSDLGQAWTVYIYHKTDNTGTEQDFTLRSDGFKVNWKQGKKLRLAEIMPSDCSIGFNVSNDAERDFVHTLLSSEVGSWYIVIRKGDSPTASIWWAGWITPAYTPYSNVSYPYFVNVKANDSIGRLVDKYNNNVETTGADDYKELTHPIQFFHDLYDIDTILGATNYKYRFAFDWWNQNTSYNILDNPLRKTFYNRAAFVKDNENFPLVIGNYLDELRGVLRSLSCRFLFADGNYWIQQDNGLDSDTINYSIAIQPDDVANEFKLNNQDNAITIDNSTNISSTTAHILAGGTYTFEPELNSVRATYLHGNRGVVFDGSNSYDTLTTIGVLGQGENEMNLSLNLRASQKWDSADVTPHAQQGEYITGYFNCVLKVGNYYLTDESTSGSGWEWVLDSGATFKVLVGIGSTMSNVWVGATGDASNGLPFSLVTQYQENTPSGFDTATIRAYIDNMTLPPLPTYGEVQFRFTPFFFYWQNTTSSWVSYSELPSSQLMQASTGLDPTATPDESSQNIALFPIGCALYPANTAASENNIGSTIIAAQNPSTQNADLNLGKLALGSSSGELNSGENTIFTLTHNDGTNYLPAGGFRRGNSGDYINPTQLLCNEYLQGQDKPVTILQATIKSVTYSPAEVIKYNDKIGGAVSRWAFRRGTFTANFDQWAGEWYKLDLTPTPAYTETDDPIVVYPDIDDPDIDDNGGTTDPLPPDNNPQGSEMSIPPILGNTLGINKNYMQGAILGYTTVKITGGVQITKVNTSALLSAIKDGQILTLCDRYGGNVTTLVSDENQVKGATDLDIESIQPVSTYEKGSLLMVRASDLLNHSGGGGGTPSGNDTNVQFNDGGAFGGSDDFTFDKLLKKLFVDGEILGKIRQNYGLSFYDNLGTSEHYLPFYSTSETTSSSVDDVNLLLTHDTEADYVVLRTDSGINGSGDIGISLKHVQLTSTTVTLIELVTVAVSSASNKKAIVFKFAANTLRKGERVLIGIKCDSGISTASRYWYASLVLSTNLNRGYTSSGVFS